MATIGVPLRLRGCEAPGDGRPRPDPRTAVIQPRWKKAGARPCRRKKHGEERPHAPVTRAPPPCGRGPRVVKWFGTVQRSTFTARKRTVSTKGR